MGGTVYEVEAWSQTHCCAEVDAQPFWDTIGSDIEAQSHRVQVFFPIPTLEAAIYSHENLSRGGGAAGCMEKLLTLLADLPWNMTGPQHQERIIFSRHPCHFNIPHPTQRIETVIASSVPISCTVLYGSIFQTTCSVARMYCR